MPDVRTLGPVGNTVNLNDTTKYRIPVSSEQQNDTYEVVQSPVLNNNLINVALHDLVAVELQMDVWVTGTSWAAVLTNYAAIQTRLDLAAAFSIEGTGTVVQYIEQAGDQGSPTTYTVKYGRLTELRARRSVQRLRMVGRLSLTCLPL